MSRETPVVLYIGQVTRGHGSSRISRDLTDGTPCCPLLHNQLDGSLCYEYTCAHLTLSLSGSESGYNLDTSGYIVRAKASHNNGSATLIGFAADISHIPVNSFCF